MEQLKRDNEYYNENFKHPAVAWRETAHGNQDAVLKTGNGLPEAAFVANVLATPSRVVRGTLKFEDVGADEGRDGYTGQTEFHVLGRVEADNAHSFKLDVALPEGHPFHNRDGAVEYNLQALDDPKIKADGYFATFASDKNDDAHATIPLYASHEEHVKAKLPVSSFDTFTNGVRLGVMFEAVRDNGFAHVTLSSGEKVKVEDLYREKSQEFAKWLVEKGEAGAAFGDTYSRSGTGRDAIISAVTKTYWDATKPGEDGEKGLIDVSGNFAAMLFACALTDALNDYKGDNRGVMPTLFELLDEASQKEGDARNQKTFKRIHDELVARYSSQKAEIMALIGASLCGMDGLPSMRATNLMHITGGSNPIEAASSSIEQSIRAKLNGLNGALDGLDGEESGEDEIGGFGAEDTGDLDEEEEEESAAWTGAYGLLDPVLNAIRLTPKEDIGHTWQGVAKVDYNGLGWGLAVTAFAALEYILLDKPYGGEWTLERGIASRLHNLGMISTPNAIMFSSGDKVTDAGETTSAFEHSYHGMHLNAEEIGTCLHEFARKVAVGGALESLYRWAGPAYISKEGTLPVLHTGAQSLTLVETAFMKYVSIIGIGEDDAVLIGHGDATGAVVFMRNIKRYSQLEILKEWFEHTSGMKFADMPGAPLPVHYQRSATVPAVLATATDERYKGTVKEQTIDNMVGVELLDAHSRKIKGRLLPANDAGVYIMEVDGEPRYVVLFDYAANKYVYADMHDGGYIIHPGRVKATKDTLQIDGTVFSPADVKLSELEELKGELMDHERKYRAERQNMSPEEKLLMQSEDEYKYQKLPVTSERVGNLLTGLLAGGAVGTGVGLATGNVGLGLAAGGLTAALASRPYYERPYYVDYEAGGYMGDYGLAAPLAGHDLGDLVLRRSCYHYYGGTYMYLRPRCYGSPFPLILPVSLFGLGNWSYGYYDWYDPYYSWFGRYRRRYPNWATRLNQKHNLFWNNYAIRNPRWRQSGAVARPHAPRVRVPMAGRSPVQVHPIRPRVIPRSNSRTTSWMTSTRRPIGSDGWGGRSSFGGRYGGGRSFEGRSGGGRGRR